MVTHEKIITDTHKTYSERSLRAENHGQWQFQLILYCQKENKQKLDIRK